MRRISAAVLVAPLLLVACGGRSLPLGGDAGPAPPPSDGAGCEVTGYRLSEIRYLDGGAPAFAPGGALVAAGGRVYYGARRTGAGNSAEDLDLFAADAASGASTQLTADDLETLLLDARGEDVLYAEQARGASYSSPVRIVRRRGASTVDLGAHVLRLAGHGDLYTDVVRRLLDGAGTVWATETHVFYHDGVAAAAIAAAKYASSPFLAGGTVVFAAHDGQDQEIYRYTGADGRLTKLTDNQSHDSSPVLVGDEVIWLCEKNICRSRGGQTEVLAQGECHPPAAGGGSAAWACGGRVSRYTPGQPLWTARAAASGTATGVRVDGVRLAWVEPDAGDKYGYNSQGTLFFSDGQHTLTVARVGLPCAVCGMYWPPLHLSLSGELLAWSYAQPAGAADPKSSPGALAYARVIAEQRCR